ncbi:MAG TPA: AsmA-like C-terminal domain-containing protein [Geminicoccaceae bacterium]|nr:AsmA-like C-terminal domain-containing protein [Geminicoccaceae bacterium]
MIFRVSKLLLRALMLLVAVALLVLGLFAWLLITGPVSVAWLTPHLERELSTERVSVDIAETQLRLGEDRTLDLSAVGVQLRDADGRLLSEVPAVEIGLSTSAMLLEGRIAVRRIDARGPTLTLIRRADGSIGLHERPDQADADEFDLRAVLVDLFAPTERGEARFLEHVRVSGGELILQDQGVGRSLHARDAELSVAVINDRVDAELAFRLDQPDGSAEVHLGTTHEAEQEWVDLDLAFENLTPAAFAEFLPDLPLAGIRLPVSGSAQSAISIAGELDPILFDFAAQAGVVDVPRLRLAELPIDALWLQGTLAADLDAVVIDQLDLSTNGARLRGRAEVDWRDGEPSLRADLEAENVTIDHVARFWPPHKGRRARAWVLEHVSAGVVPSARAQLRFGPGELEQKPLPDDALAGEFTFEDLSVRYVDTMPPLVGVDGRATFTGQSMDFTVASGHVGDLVVDQGSVVITGIGFKGHYTTQLEVVADISGPVDQALSLLDHPPLEFASRAKLDPEAASGRVAGELRIGMPLHRGFDRSEVRVAAEATITDVAIATEAIDVSGGQLRLTVDAETVNVAGEAVVNGIPLTLEVQDRLGENGIDRRYQVSGSPDASALRGLGVDLPIGLEGEIGLSATVVETPAGRTADIALDLTPTAIDVPQLNWHKTASVPGALNASANIPADGPLQVTAFTLMSDGLSAEGSLEAQLEPFRLAQLHVDRVRFGDTRAAVVLRPADPSGYDVRIEADTLDLAPWLDREEPEGGRGGASLDASWRIDLQAQRLLVRGAAFTAVDADLVRGPDGWHSADMRGRQPGGGEFALTLTPEGERRRLRLTSTNAGNLLQALDQTSRIEGGEFRLDASIVRQQPTLEAEGSVVAREFAVLDAPILARLLTVASLEGIGNLLGGQGIAFDHLDVPFTLRNELLQLGRGRMYGSQLGLTFQGWVNLATDTLDLEGTIVPLYGINWTIGQIPIIGRLLRGAEGEGAFALTYSMRGPLGQPSITVNPLSALAPGFLRDLFSGLREGTLEPPEMPSSRDR